MSDNGASKTQGPQETVDAFGRPKDKLLEHEYDGIRELDNPTPGWWHAIFLGSVLFSILYFAFFHLSPVSWSIQDRWDARQVSEYRRVFGRLGELAQDEPTIIAMTQDEQMMAIARGLFIGNCAACHASDGGGINGVNLTDDHYKSVARLGDILNVINKGANNGAMPPWENRLSGNERVILAAYVARLRGTTPANPRSPEGEVIPPFGIGVARAR